MTLLLNDAPPYQQHLDADDAVQLLPRLSGVVTGSLEPETESALRIVRAMRDAVTRPENVERLRASWPLVGEFLRAEFDFVTPGRRGIGRMSTSPPRLAGEFRAELALDPARRALGKAAEELVVSGWAAHAAMQLALADGPFEVRARSPEETWELWIPGIYAATRNAGPTADAVLSSALEPASDRFLRAAEEHGLVGGLLGRRRNRRTLEHIAFFYLSAGVSLMAINTSQGDSSRP